MEAKKRPGWKLWSERPDVVIGKEEEEEEDPGQARNDNAGKGNQKLDVEENPDVTTEYNHKNDVEINLQ